MMSYIAELDETKNIAAVWVKQSASRGAAVFDPNKHIFDPLPSDSYFGAPRGEIESWIERALRQN